MLRIHSIEIYLKPEVLVDLKIWKKEKVGNQGKLHWNKNRMFDNYYENTFGGDRPKYGILHISNNP